MPKFNKIVIIGRRNSAHLLEQVSTLANCLQNYGCEVYLDSSIAHELGSMPFRVGQLCELINHVELAVIIGGDGTMLAAGRELVNHNIPLVGINQGRLGFMTDIAAEDMLPQLAAMLVHDQYREEERSLLFAQVIRAGQVVYQGEALNDIVISRGAIGSMIEFEMSINQELVHTQKADGVIFATPTGSTAYSLAAGGPILHPHSRVFSIVPICPQSMSNRPIVISDDVSIELSIVKDNTCLIHYDGQEYYGLNHRDQIKICKAKRPLRLLHPLDYNYYHTLRTKLDWAKRVS